MVGTEPQQVDPALGPHSRWCCIATPDVGGASAHRAGLQVGETEPFIAELLGELTTTIQDLETHQIHMFYEAVGLMISADADNRRRDQYLVSALAFSSLA